MKMKLGIFSVGLMAAMATGSYADQASKQKDFCHALEQYSLDLSKLEEITPKSTIGEVRSAADQVKKDADQVVKTAGKMDSPAAKQFEASAKTLHSDAKGLSKDMTVEQAKSRLSGDLTTARQSLSTLAEESGCPAAMPPKASESE